MLRNVRIGVRLVLGFGVMIALLVGISAKMTHGLRETNGLMTAVVQDRYPKSLVAKNIDHELATIARSARDAVLLEDPAETKVAWEQVGEARDRLGTLYRDLADSVHSDAGKVVVARMRGEDAEFMRTLQAAEDDARKPDRTAALRLITGPLRQQDKRYEILVQQLVQLQEADIRQAGEEAARIYQHNYDEGMAVSGVAVLLAMVLAWWMTRSITRPLLQTDALVQEIAEGEGDLTRRLPEHGRDELSDLCRHFNAFMGRLQEMVRTISRSTDHVASASEELSAVTEQTKRGAEQQSGEIEQLATAMNQMSATVQEVARSTARASEQAQQAVLGVHAGNATVDSAVRSIEALAAEVMGAAQTIQDLAEESESIGQVLDVIKNITEQTNLLALNAAIEAARAGEQGRGFSVVAGEVRTLAQRTQVSTEEIETMIQRLQQGVKRTVDAMQGGRDKAAVSVAEARQAGEALASIDAAVTTITDMTTQIAGAAEQQSAVAEDINRNISNISQVAVDNASGAEQSAAAGAQLARLAVELSTMVSRFRV